MALDLVIAITPGNGFLHFVFRPAPLTIHENDPMNLFILSAVPSQPQGERAREKVLFWSRIAALAPC